MDLIPTMDMTSSEQSRSYWARRILDWIYQQNKPTSIADLLVDYTHLSSYLSSNLDKTVTVKLVISNTVYDTITTLYTEISSSTVFCDQDCSYFIIVVPEGYIYIQKAKTNTLYTIKSVYPYACEHK